MYRPTDEIKENFTAITLQNFKVCVSEAIDAELLQDKSVNIESYVNMMNNTAITTYKTFFQGEIIKTPTVKVPKTWWQHFKRDKMPEWYNNRFPVKYKIYGIELAHIYEEFIPGLNQKGKTILLRGPHLLA